MRRLLLLAGAAVLVAACENASPLQPTPLPAFSASESSQAPEREHYQVDREFFTENPCNGETVLVSGRMHFVRSMVREEGSYSWRYHVNSINLQGVGLTTGDHYTYVEVQNSDATFADPTRPPFFPINGDVMQAFRVISRSGTANYMLQTVYDYGKDENGPYWNQRVMHRECRG
ncbi:MAG TPA: hypothetical protein VF263_10865 [Longimicrobiaceae bacterium]